MLAFLYFTYSHFLLGIFVLVFYEVIESHQTKYFPRFNPITLILSAIGLKSVTAPISSDFYVVLLNDSISDILGFSSRMQNCILQKVQGHRMKSSGKMI